MPKHKIVFKEENVIRYHDRHLYKRSKEQLMTGVVTPFDIVCRNVITNVRKQICEETFIDQGYKVYFHHNDKDHLILFNK